MAWPRRGAVGEMPAGLEGGRNVRVWAAGLLGMALLAGGRATSDPAGVVPTPEAAADEVVKAIRAKDAESLKRLAAAEKPDPWLVADELLVRGEAAAAERFAAAAPRYDVERLPAYVASRRGKPDAQAARKALAVATTALERGDEGAARSALDGVAGEEGTVLFVRIELVRGFAHRTKLADPAGVAALHSAAESAETLGWHAMASRALIAEGYSAYRARDFRGALAVWERQLVVEEERGSRAGVAGALGDIGNAYIGLKDYPKALECQERAYRSRKAVGDRAGAAPRRSRTWRSSIGRSGTRRRRPPSWSVCALRIYPYYDPDLRRARGS
jgi:hypothetical protein